MANNQSPKKPQEIFSTIINLIICLIIVLVIFVPTLNRPWLIYDERIIFDNSFFPVPTNFTEIFETIKEFGLDFSFLSSNTMYSSNYVKRTSPISLILNMLLNLFFKKNRLLYHSFVLMLHFINTGLVYFILKFFLNIKDKPNFLNRCLTIILTLIWAIHPTNLESILLSTNFPPVLTYTFFFSFFLDFLINKEKNKSILRKLVIPLLFLIPMLCAEFIVVLPFVLLIVSFYFSYQLNSFKIATKKSIEETTPYFIGLFFYVIFFLFFSHIKTNQQTNEHELIVFIERIFWLSPQIFFHSLKLVFYPKILSIDQTLFVHLGKTLFDPYSIFCFIFLASWLFIPFFFFIVKRKFSNIFLLCWTFFFGLLPFLHIVMPSYALSAERYLYCPLALLIFGIARILSGITNNKLRIPLLLFLPLILVFCLIRSHNRTLDWKDNYSFINSTYKTTNNPFFRAVGLGMLGKAITILEANQDKSKRYFLKSLKLLQEAKKEIFKMKLRYQKTLPLVIKSYGLDYDSSLTKIAFLEASSRCLELNQDQKIGLKILEPFMKRQVNLDPRICELYAYLLTQDKKYDEAKNILLKANSLYPHTQFILLNLFDLALNHEKDKTTVEKYLLEALKFYPYDLSVLRKALSFYQGYGESLVTAKYAYLFGLRTQSQVAYEQALTIYLNLNQLKEAKKIIPKLLRIDPNNPQALYFISRYYYKTKDYEKSLSYLKNAYLISIKSQADLKLVQEIGNTLAELYLFLGNKEEAFKIQRLNKGIQGG